MMDTSNLGILMGLILGLKQISLGSTSDAGHRSFSAVGAQYGSAEDSGPDANCDGFLAALLLGCLWGPLKLKIPLLEFPPFGPFS